MEGQISRQPSLSVSVRQQSLPASPAPTSGSGLSGAAQLNLTRRDQGRVRMACRR